MKANNDIEEADKDLAQVREVAVILLQSNICDQAVKTSMWYHHHVTDC